MRMRRKLPRVDLCTIVSSRVVSNVPAAMSTSGSGSGDEGKVAAKISTSKDQGNQQLRELYGPF